MLNALGGYIDRLFSEIGLTSSSIPPKFILVLVGERCEFLYPSIVRCRLTVGL